MSTFYSRYDIGDIMPDLERQRPGADDSLRAGHYVIKVIGDSSILILKAPLDSIGLDNIIFAYARTALLHR